MLALLVCLHPQLLILDHPVTMQQSCIFLYSRTYNYFL